MCILNIVVMSILIKCEKDNQNQSLIWVTNDFLHLENYDHRSYERNLSNCAQKPEKVRTSTGFEPRDLAIPVRCSNQLSYEATDVGSWSFVSSKEPVKNGREVIYEKCFIY